MENGNNLPLSHGALMDIVQDAMRDVCIESTMIIEGMDIPKKKMRAIFHVLHNATHLGVHKVDERMRQRHLKAIEKTRKKNRKNLKLAHSAEVQKETP